MKRTVYFSLAAAFLLSVIPISSCRQMSSEQMMQPGNMPPPGNMMSDGMITISDNSFSPASITVTTGTIVRWTNRGAMTHTVTSGLPGNPTGLFDSGNLAPGASFIWTARGSGQLDYHCRLHAGMTGVISVR